jgi:hypothetical protein
MGEVVGDFCRCGMLEPAIAVPANPQDVVVAQIVLSFLLIDVFV